MAVALSGLVAVACGGGGDGGGGEGFGERFSVTAALAEIPRELAADDEGRVEIYAADLLAASELVGAARPTGSTDEQEVIDWLGALTGMQPAPIYVPLPPGSERAVIGLAEVRDELGFAMTDVDAFVSWSAPPVAATVWVGELSPNAAPEVAPGVRTFGEGDDFDVGLGELTAARPLGRPLRLAEDAGRVITTTSTEVATAWLDGERTRLLDDPRLDAVAAALDDKGVVAAAVFGNDFSAAELDIPEDVLDRLVLADGFDVVGLGWGNGDRGDGTIVVQDFGNPAAADRAAPAVEALWRDGESLRNGRPLADLFTLERVEVVDSLVVTTLVLHPDRPSPQLLLSMLVSGDGPFLHR